MVPVRTSLCCAVAAAMIAVTSPAMASGKSIAGSWQGNGNVTNKDGGKYKVTCKVSIKPEASKKHFVSGSCSNSEGTAAAQGYVTRSKPGRYYGQLNGMVASVIGKVSIRSWGNRMSVVIRSATGRAVVSLRRTGN